MGGAEEAIHMAIHMNMVGSGCIVRKCQGTLYECN